MREAIKTLLIWGGFIIYVLLFASLLAPLIGCTRNIDISETCPETLLRSDPAAWHDCCANAIRELRLRGIGWAESVSTCYKLMDMYEGQHANEAGGGVM